MYRLLNDNEDILPSDEIFDCKKQSWFKVDSYSSLDIMENFSFPIRRKIEDSCNKENCITCGRNQCHLQFKNSCTSYKKSEFRMKPFIN